MNQRGQFQLLIDRDAVKFTLQGIPDRPGIAAEVFRHLSTANINVELIVQSASTGEVSDIAMVVKEEYVQTAEAKLQNICPDMCAKGFIRDDNLGLLTLSRENIFKIPGIAARLFRVLAYLSINIDMISTSFDAITCCIREADLSKAYQAVVKEFNIPQNH